MFREEDVKEMCKQVLEMFLDMMDDPNGPYVFTCPLCWATEERKGNEERPKMETFKHNSDCAYLIAKDLMDNA